MSLLQQLRNKRLPRNVSYLENIKAQQEIAMKQQQEEVERKLKENQAKDQIERERMYIVKKMKEEEKKELENIKIVNENRETVMKEKIKEEIEVDTIKSNKTLNELISGFLSIEMKERPKYIKTNAENFKSLNPREQQTLYKLYAKYL